VTEVHVEPMNVQILQQRMYYHLALIHVTSMQIARTLKVHSNALVMMHGLVMDLHVQTWMSVQIVLHIIAMIMVCARTSTHHLHVHAMLGMMEMVSCAMNVLSTARIVCVMKDILEMVRHLVMISTSALLHC
jgi:hypothetical protein